MRDDSEIEIPSSERDTARLPVVKLDTDPPLWHRGEIAMAVVAVVCVIIAAVVVITGILPLMGV